MKERPILFSGPMVRAILAGTKTQTRRVVRYPRSWLTPYADGDKAKAFTLFHTESTKGSFWIAGCDTPDHWQCGDERLPQNYLPGDRLWVRETFRLSVPAHKGQTGFPIYHADFDEPPAGLWKPSIFMPRWACRIVLEIAAVRVERLQSITEADAQAEGAERGIWCNDGVFCQPVDAEDEKRASYRHGYGFLWECINGRGSWELNPWVWVIEFRRVQP